MSGTGSSLRAGDRLGKRFNERDVSDAGEIRDGTPDDLPVGMATPYNGYAPLAPVRSCGNLEDGSHTLPSSTATNCVYGAGGNMSDGMGSRRYIAQDGTPQYVIWAEQWLIGGALQAPRASLPTVDPDDFHDASLAIIWQAIHASDGEPSLSVVATHLAKIGALDDVGAEPRLANLLTSPHAMTYSGKAAMAAHAGIITEWGEKRRAMALVRGHLESMLSGRVVIDASARFTAGRVGEMPR